MSKNLKNDKVVAPEEIIDPLSSASCVDERDKRHRALESLVSLLPVSAKRNLIPRLKQLRQEETHAGGLSRPEPTGTELELFSEIRRSLNEATIQGSLGRREFLKIAGLLVTSGLGAMIFPQSADAMYNMGAFWKKKKAAAGAGTSNGNGGVAATPSTNLWNSSSLDPYWDYVTLLMNFDGSNGATTFSDESNVGKTPTSNGSPYIDIGTGSSPYSGRNGALRTSATGNYVSFPASTDWDLSSGDFTIEFWMKFNSKKETEFLSLNSGSGVGGFELYYNSSINKIGFYRATTGALVEYTPSWNTGQWYHLAFVKAGTTYTLYNNGTSVATNTTASTPASVSGALNVGGYSQAGYDFDGWMADLRIYKGVAKYTANFTAPSSPIGLGSTKDPNWSYCVLACPFENSLKDMSGKSFTSSGGPVLATAQKKFGTASGAFNGSNYLQTPDSADFDFANTDMTIECWVYLNATTNPHTFVTQAASANDFNWRFGTRYGSPNSGFHKLHLQRSGYGGAIGTTALASGVWTHVAVSIKNNVIRFFVNGTEDVIQTSPAYSDCMANSSNPLRIGFDADGGLNGYIDSLRITRGYARYTSSFTAPTASFPIGKDETTDPFWTYTVLAMHMDDFTDSTGRHAFTNNNSVSISSSSKFGTGCASFNGSNTSLSHSSHSDWDLNSDFTAEAWVQPTAASGTQHLMGSYDGTIGWTLYLQDQQLSIAADYSGSYKIALVGGIFSAGKWNHVAFTVQGSIVRLFLNGVKVAEGTKTGTVSNSTTFYIGRWAGSVAPLNGYMDDLRITKGVARYLQNFIPPTRAFASESYNPYASTYDPFWHRVMLGLPMNGANGSTTITDATGRHTITNNGAVTTNTSTYKFGTASASFTGTSTSTLIPSNTNGDFSFGSNDFTWETWVRLNSLSGTVGIMGYLYNGFYATALLFHSTSGLYFYNVNANSVDLIVSQGSTAGWATNTWYHVAVSRSGNTVRLFKDGLQVASATYSGSLQNYASAIMIVGQDDQNRYFSGYLDDLRLTKGVARYTGSYSVPTAAFPTQGIITSGLACVLDAGDTSSYTGSSTTWKNLWSSPADGSAQSAYDFYLGASSSVEASDPTFVGIAGGRSANDYFTTAGSQYFVLAGSNTTFINSIHKTGATLTIGAVVCLPTATSSGIIIGNTPGANAYSYTGFAFGLDGTRNVYLGIRAGNGSFAVTNINSGSSMVAGWNIILLSFKEGVGYTWLINGMQYTGSGSASYSGASSASASATTRMLGDTAADATYAFTSGARLAQLMMWNTNLSFADLKQTFDALRSRYGL